MSVLTTKHLMGYFRAAQLTRFYCTVALNTALPIFTFNNAVNSNELTYAHTFLLCVERTVRICINLKIYQVKPTHSPIGATHNGSVFTCFSFILAYVCLLVCVPGCAVQSIAVLLFLLLTSPIDNK